MSLYGSMRTSTAGMQAQSSRISTVAENVANSNTTGYKAVRMEFSSLFIGGNVSSYNSGGLNQSVRRLVSAQGTPVSTNSPTDLAIDGEGFFVVENSQGERFMTRVGSFTPNTRGELVNAAGFKLLAYPLANGDPTVTVNGYAGMEPVIVDASGLSAKPSTTGVFAANVPSTATIVAAADLPSTNAAGAEYTKKTSLITYGNLGEEVMLDIYFSKSANNQWEMAVYNQADATPGTGFPYSSAALATQTLDFDPNNGALDSSSADSITIPVPGGQSLALDLSGMSQLATDYTTLKSNVNGNVASSSNVVEIADDGTVFVAYGNGQRQAKFRVPLATVTSQDNLQVYSGNVFGETSDSGPVRIGFPNDPGFGKVSSGVLEQSTSDIASEFTDMIDAQRAYTANSKVFMTSAELLDVLVNLKR